MPIESNNRVGATDLFLPRLGFGAAPLGGFRGKIQESEVNEILQAAFDHNVTYFDTSPYYRYGRSELRIGNFLREDQLLNVAHIFQQNTEFHLAKPNMEHFK